MKLVLDEMWSPAIAVELRRRGHDVIAAQEPAHRGRYGALPDDVVFEQAQEDGRAVVTDNIRDYELARHAWESRGLAHHGVVYALDPHFNRHRGNTVIGSMVRALDALLEGASGLPWPLNCAHYLRPAP